MMTDQLFNILMQTISSFDRVESYDREHVFYDIMRFASKLSTQDDRLSMHYNFNEYQKILTLLRSNNIILGEYRLENINKHKILYSNSIIDKGMSSLYFPIISYYYYKKKNYNKALEVLENAYKSIDELYNEGFRSAPYSFLEQKTNEFRILLRKEDTEKAMDVAVLLMSEILNHKTFFNFDISFIKLTNNKNELISLLTYLLDIIISNSRLFKKESCITKDNIINFIQRVIILMSKNDSSLEYNQFYQTLKAVDLVLKGENEKYFNTLAHFQPNYILNNQLSSTSAYLLYKSIFDFLKEKDIFKFKEVFNLYKNNKHSDGYEFFIKRMLEDITFEVEHQFD